MRTIMPPRPTGAHHLAPPVDLRAAALDAAAHGWAVLPCHPRGPRAKAPIAQLVPHGHLDASTDPGMVGGWWTRWPAALIGAAVPASLVVLDVDPRNGGSMAALVDVLGALPVTMTAWSGRGDGGCHLYFLRPPGPLSATGLPAGVDLKAAGYCILPPSPHPATGAPYAWEHHPFTALPTRAVAALSPPPRRCPSPSRTGGSGAVGGLVRVVERAPEGGRNAALYWSARRAVEHGQTGALDELAAAAVAAGLSETEAQRTVRSAASAHQRGQQ